MVECDYNQYQQYPDRISDHSDRLVQSNDDVHGVPEGSLLLDQPENQKSVQATNDKVEPKDELKE